MMRANQLDVERAFAFVIDIQEKLLPSIGHQDRVVAAARKLLDGLRCFSMPVLATEQYPKGIGATQPDIQQCLQAADATVIEKMTFSSCGEPPVREALQKLDRPQAIVIGIEAHVCVQQTTLDLRAMDYDVFVCADAVGSRGRLDYENALERMRQEGAFITTVESVLFELCNRCDTPEFKNMIKVVKATPPPND